MRITRIEGPQRLLPPFKSEHLEWMRTSQPAITSLKRRAHAFPHGWLKVSNEPGYTTYDYVDHSQVH